MSSPAKSDLEVPRDPLAAARWVLDRYAVEAPKHITVEAIAMDLGLTIADGELSGAGARLTRVGDRGIIRISDALKSVGRRRFSVAHELGHFLLDHQESGWIGCLEEEMLEFGGKASAETEANLFASELLLPEAIFRNRVEGRHIDLRSLIRLADEFRTSVTSSALRFVETTPERRALVLSAAGQVSWWRRSKAFGCWLRGRGQEIHPASLTSRFFHGKEVPVRPMDVPAEAWLEEKDAAGHTIVEDSMVIPSMKAVLTLLWIPPAEGVPAERPSGSGAEAAAGSHRGRPARSGPETRRR